MFCRSLFVLLYFFLLVIVLSVLLRYTDSGCLPLVSSNSSYRIYTKIVFCKFSQYYWWTLHNCLFFSNKKLMMKRQFWLFMIFTSLINCWKMTIIKTNKQKRNKLKTNRKQTGKNKQTNKQSQKRKKNRSIEIVHKGLLHMHFPKKTHSNGYFNFCQTVLRLFQIILLIKEDGSWFILS